MIYPLTTFPKSPATEKLVLNRRQSRAESPWTYSGSTVDTAAQWSLEWTWPSMSLAKAEACAGWLLSLKGQIGSFRYSPRQHVRSTLVGITLAQPGYAYNDTIRVKGWAANAATGLRVGQWLSIGTQLLRVIEAGAFADAAGATTITVSPFLRATFATGTAVEFVAPAGVFSLATPDGHGYTLTPDRSPQFGAIQAREVV